VLPIIGVLSSNLLLPITNLVLQGHKVQLDRSRACVFSDLFEIRAVVIILYETMGVIRMGRE
jgi:hypothetical protein